MQVARVQPVARLALAILVLAGCTSGGTESRETYLPASSPISLTPQSGPADWWIDPADLPLSATTTRIHGFLNETSCASGRSPAGRVVGPEISYRPDSVIVTFRVHRDGGAQTCQGNPRYPVIVELAEPVGGRSVIDGGSGRDATIDPTVTLIPVEDCGPLIRAETDDAKVACLAMINATLGDRYQEFARVTVAPDGEPCSDNECAAAEGIEARAWRVEATDRDGAAYAWRCTYKDEVAACDTYDRGSSATPAM